MTKGDIADYAELMMNLAKDQRAYIESCKRAARAMEKNSQEEKTMDTNLISLYASTWELDGLADGMRRLIGLPPKTRQQKYEEQELF